MRFVSFFWGGGEGGGGGFISLFCYNTRGKKKRK